MTTGEIAVKKAEEANSLRIYAQKFFEETKGVKDLSALLAKIEKFRADVESVK